MNLHWYSAENLHEIRKGTAGAWISNWDIGGMVILLDKLCLFDLMDEVMTTYISQAKTENIILNARMTVAPYKVLPQGSPLRKHALFTLYFIMSALPNNERFLTMWPLEEIQKALEHGDLRMDYLRLVGERTPAKDPRKMPRCVLHHNGEEEACSMSDSAS